MSSAGQNRNRTECLIKYVGIKSDCLRIWPQYPTPVAKCKQEIIKICMACAAPEVLFSSLFVYCFAESAVM